jgi:hypothetical protein
MPGCILTGFRAQQLHRLCRHRNRDPGAHRGVQARRVERVVARDRRQHRGRVAHAARERANTIERRRVREQAVARDAAVRRLNADAAVEVRRLAD